MYVSKLILKIDNINNIHFWDSQIVFKKGVLICVYVRIFGMYSIEPSFVCYSIRYVGPTTRGLYLLLKS